MLLHKISTILDWNSQDNGALVTALGSTLRKIDLWCASKRCIWLKTHAVRNTQHYIPPPCQITFNSAGWTETERLKEHQIGDRAPRAKSQSLSYSWNVLERNWTKHCAAFNRNSTNFTARKIHLATCMNQHTSYAFLNIKKQSDIVMLFLTKTTF